MRRDAPEGLLHENPFSSSYRAVFGRSPLPARQPDSFSSPLEPEQQLEFHRDGAMLQLFPSKGEVHCISHLRMDHPRREPGRGDGAHVALGPDGAGGRRRAQGAAEPGHGRQRGVRGRRLARQPADGPAPPRTAPERGRAPAAGGGPKL